jgi:hypothetical protein
MAHHDDVAKVQLLDQLSEVIGVLVHVVALPSLGGPTVSAPVVGGGAIARVRHQHSVVVPRIGIEGQP